MKLTTFFFLFISLSVYAQEAKTIQEVKEQSLIDYSNIKSVLKTDGLIRHKKEKEKEIKQILKTKKKISLDRYNYPSKEDFWSFMSELWLVKNAQSLSWDFTKPDYGIGEAFKGLLEKIGFYNKKIKILVINSPELTHAALPGNKDEYYFLISLPFMRTLDLTKVDISILFLEDMLRIEEGYFIENIKVDKSFIGSNFYESKFDEKILKTILNEYTKILFNEGFSFQQQYTVTKKMDRLLKSEPFIWSSYLKMINKIDGLIKTNLLYKDYTKIYPSPELQIKWLSPKKKIL